MHQNDALLEVLGTTSGLRFTFLDRSRPSLSFEQDLDVPPHIFPQIDANYKDILRSISHYLVRGERDYNVAERPKAAQQSDRIYKLSEQIRDLLLPEDLVAHLRDFRPTSLLIRTDRPQVPWELARLNHEILGVKIPTGRSLLTHRPLRRAIPRLPKRSIRVLLIANPTSDLPGAEREARELAAVFDSHPFFDFDVLLRAEASLGVIQDRLQARAYDVIHYAGHSDYSSSNVRRGVLALSDAVIPAKYLAKLIERRPPMLFFLNSCNSGVVDSAGLLFEDLSGAAPHFLRAGVDAVIGVSWPVIDKSASKIATSFYSLIASGQSVGQALNEARSMTLGIDKTPYWLGYSLFGDPNLEVISDFSWKAPAIRSGGVAAAMSTFSGRASLHVSSIHSFLMSTAEADTCALCFACECTNSEAVVYKQGLSLEELIETRPIKVGLPGKTGSAVFLRKVLAEKGIQSADCSFVELDTAEVKVALDNGAIDITVLWEPTLSSVNNKDQYKIDYSSQHQKTICVLVARKPRTRSEEEACDDAVRIFSHLCRELESNRRRWAFLLSQQTGLPVDACLTSLRAYDFGHAGATAASLPVVVQELIENELTFLQEAGLLEVSTGSLFWSSGIVDIDSIEQAGRIRSNLVADIQWSPSSLPLLMGRYLGYFG